jgi:hypothetical protein
VSRCLAKHVGLPVRARAALSCKLALLAFAKLYLYFALHVGLRSVGPVLVSLWA